MHICYIDESGSIEILEENSVGSTPVMVIGGFIVDSKVQRNLIWDFLQLKSQYNPRLKRVKLSVLIAEEVKGSELRKDLRPQKSTRTIRRSIHFMLEVIKLLEKYECKLVGRVLVKEKGKRYKDLEIYPGYIAWIAKTFEHYLSVHNSNGIMLLDSRTKNKNTPLTSNIVTRFYSSGKGRLLQHLVDAPAFGNSDAHVGLQIADIVVSGMIFPLACNAFCTRYDWNTHCSSTYSLLRNETAARLKALQYRYRNEKDSPGTLGGIYVTGASKLRSADLFSDKVLQDSLF